MAVDQLTDERDRCDRADPARFTPELEAARSAAAAPARITIPDRPTPAPPSRSSGADAAADDPLRDLASPRRLALRLAVFAGALLLAALAVRSVPGLGEVRARLADVSPAGVTLIALLELGSVLGFVAALRGAFSNIPPWRIATALGTAEQAANVLLPAGGIGGLALGAVVARDAGVPKEIAVTRTVALFLVTSSVTFAGIVAGGVLAGLDGVPWYGSIVPATLAALVAGAVASLPRPLHSGDGRLRNRMSTSTRAGVVAARRLVRDPNPTLLTGAVAYFALDVGALAAAFHAVGAETLPLGAFLLAYTLGQAGGMLPLPGGVGGVDGGLIGMFVLYGASPGDATAAVLAYRLFQLGIPVLCGLAGILALTHERRTRRDPAAVAASFAGVDAEPRS